jgi:purine-binding chemotaxis protein CheW
MSKSDQRNDQTGQYVSFKLHGEEYGVPILSVHEIIRYETVTRVPQSMDFIDGVLNLRGRVIPVVNLRMKFGLPQREVDNSTRIMVVDVNSRVVGMVVDEVCEVQDINADEISPAPPLGAKINTEYITGMGKIEDRLMILLNLNKIFTLDEGEQVEEAARV